MTRLRILLLLVLSAFLFYAAGRMHEPLLTKRQVHYEDVDDSLVDSDPLIAFTTVALGGFRGVMADLLWVRVSQLQDEGRYFEIVQLSDWITKLEPRIDSVWGYHAWNMAYNISVILQNPEDRWRWVNHGVHLLRDQGLRYNPASARLYWELSWLFHHKIGGAFDEAHPYYRREWARQMTVLFGGPGPDYERLLAAPASRDALLSDPDMAALVRDLEQGHPHLLSENAVTDDERMRFLAELAQSDGRGAKLLDYVRARDMRQVYRLDPALMQKLDRQYGPLDWRLPHSHALYWASRGLPFARGFDVVSLHRVIYQSLAEGFSQGTLQYDPATDRYELSPAWDYMEHVLAAIEAARAERPELKSFTEARVYFLAGAIALYEEHGRMADAELVRVRLEQEFPEILESLGLARTPTPESQR